MIQWQKKEVKVLVYDIETSEYVAGKEEIPIDIIGYTTFDISFESSKNLQTEDFSFDILTVLTIGKILNFTDDFS